MGKDGGVVTGAAARGEDEDPVSPFTADTSQGGVVLPSLGPPSSAVTARSYPSVLPNASDGIPSKVSKFSGAGLYFTSPTSFGPTCRRTQHHATKKVWPWNFALTPVSSISRTTAGSRHRGALSRFTAL